MTKRDLESFRILEREKKQLERIRDEKLREIREDAAFPKSPSISDMPKAPPIKRDKLARAMEELEETEEKYDKKIADICLILREIETWIEKLPPAERVIAREKYIIGKTVEEISDDKTIGYAKTSVNDFLKKIGQKCIKSE